MSEVSFRKKFRQYAGMTPSAYILKQKLQHAKRLLRSGLYSVAEAAQGAGFDDPSYFSKVFKKHTGLLPGEYMRR
jgi:AraC-like DNA-binding protein